MHTRALTALILGGLLLGGWVDPTPAIAQDEQTRSAPEPMARFGEAQALSVDPLGRLYVADAGRDVVVVLDEDGAVQEELGGSGTRAGEFDTPSDVDPTNGHTLLVADTRNGRIQRFSAERQYLEAVPVGEPSDSEDARRVFDDGRDGAAVQGRGRPIAVASNSGDETYVLDERDAVVLKWDDRRQPERIVGGLASQDATLRAPVALALDGSRRLYVADAEQAAVFAYDGFGTFIERLPLPAVPDVRALTMHQGTLWIVCSERVLVWNRATESLTEHAVDLEAPLVDAARVEDRLYLLTSSRLVQRTSWE